MVNINVTVPGTLEEIDLGFRAENKARCVVFDVSEWVEQYGATGSFALKHKPAGSSSYYPIAVSLDTDTSTVTWNISSSDTATNGVGELQLVYAVGSDDTTTCSAVWQTYVHRSLGADAEAPDPYSDWVLEVQVAVATADAAAAEAKAAAAKAAEDASAAVADKVQEAVDAADEAKDAAQDAKETAEEVSQTIETQIEAYLADPTHQSAIAEKISLSALNAKLDKDDADVLAVLAKY